MTCLKTLKNTCIELVAQGAWVRRVSRRTFVTPEDGQFILEIEKHIGLLLDEEVVEGMQASTVDNAAPAKRAIGDLEVKGPRILRPIAGGIRLGRRRRR